MINTLVLNWVSVILLMLLKMCLNESHIDKHDNFDDEVPALGDIDGKDEYSSSSSRPIGKIANKEDSYNENSKYNESELDKDYSNSTNMSEIRNETEKTWNENYLKSTFPFFTFGQDKHNNESGNDGDDYFPRLLKEDSYTKSNAIDQVHIKNKRSQYDLQIKIAKLKNADNTRRKRFLVSSAFDAKINYDKENIKYKKPYLRIVNGRPAKLGDVPYQVAFKMITENKHFMTYCGGTIIGPTKLISAAHCFEGRKRGLCQNTGSRTATRNRLRNTRVVAGNLRNLVKENDGGQWRMLHSMYFPMKYKFPNEDISVGYVKEAFRFNAKVNKIPYAKEFTDFDDITCLVSGYGRINKDESSDKLLLADLVLRSTEYCTKIHQTDMKKFICTEELTSDTEKGDSGGPLVCDGTLVGVVSGHRYYSGSFFTRVSSYSDYITRGDAWRLTCNSSYTYFVHILLIAILRLLPMW